MSHITGDDRLKNDKILSMLGLAVRSGNLVGGEFSVDKAIKEKKARLVIVACDASDNTKKGMSDACRFYKIPYMEYGDKESLGHFTGKDIRASVAVTDEGFAKALLRSKEEIDG